MGGCCVGVWQPLLQQLEPQWSCWCLTCRALALPSPQGLSPTLPAYGRWLAQQAKQRAAGGPVVLLGHSLVAVVLHAAGLLGDQLRGHRFAGLWRWGLPTPAIHPTGGLRPVALQRDAAPPGAYCSHTLRRAVAGLPKLVSQLAVPSLWVGGEKDQVMQPLYVR